MWRIRPPTTSIPAGDNTNKTSISFVYRQPVARRQRLQLQLQLLLLLRLRRLLRPQRLPRLHRQLRPHQQPPQPLRRALLLPLRQGRRPRRDPGPRPSRVLHRGRDLKPGDRWSVVDTVPWAVSVIGLPRWIGFSEDDDRRIAEGAKISGGKGAQATRWGQRVPPYTAWIGFCLATP
jgi:hypothetical protein